MRCMVGGQTEMKVQTGYKEKLSLHEHSQAVEEII